MQVAGIFFSKPLLLESLGERRETANNFLFVWAACCDRCLLGQRLSLLGGHYHWFGGR